MTKKELSNILLLYFKIPSIKKIRTNRVRPSYEKMYILWEKHGIPFQAWKDIKAWLKEQESQKAE